MTDPKGWLSSGRITLIEKLRDGGDDLRWSEGLRY
jgi:hypothetical protein